MDQPFQAYTGDEPYVFVCYAHGDSKVVYPEMVWLREQSTNLWYDEGISAGENWRGAIGDSLLGASHVLFYISKHSLQSDHCNREINLALDEGKEIVPIYLEDVELTSDLKVGLNRVHALHRDQDGSYQQHLLNALGQATPIVNSQDDRKSEYTISPSATKAGAFAKGRGGYIFAALLLAVIGFIAVQQFAGLDQSVINDKSIAILALDNLSPDPENDYFAAGVHEEILNQLAKISDIEVTSRTSVMRYQDSDLNIIEIANELEVSFIMEGSVRFADNQVVITLQLIQASEDVHRWSESYREKYENIFDIQADVAKQVAIAMQAVLSPSEIASIERPATASTEAYNLYLKSRHQSREQGQLAPIDDNIANMEKALVLDPLFARGRAYLGFLKYWKGQYGPVEERDALSDTAIDYANEAIEIDSDIELGYIVLADVSFDRRRFDEWERYMLQAVQLPDLEGDAANTFASNLALRGQYEEAWHWDNVAISKNKTSVLYLGTAAWHRIAAGDYETGLTMFESARAVGADAYNYLAARAYVLNRLGRDAESLEDLKELDRERLLPSRTPSGEYHAYLLCQQGEQESVMADLEQWQGIRKELKIIYCAAGTGELDAIFASYDRAMEDGEIIPYNDLITDEIRADSRWQNVLNYMDLRDPD